MLIATHPRDPHRRGARLTIDALAPTDQFAAVVAWWLGEVDLAAVRTPRLEFEELPLGKM